MENKENGVQRSESWEKVNSSSKEKKKKIRIYQQRWTYDVPEWAIPIEWVIYNINEAIFPKPILWYKYYIDKKIIETDEYIVSVLWPYCVLW